jgi:hypothetical protein
MQRTVYFHYVWQKRQQQQQFQKIRIVFQEMMEDDEKAILRLNHVVMDRETMVQDATVLDVMVLEGMGHVGIDQDKMDHKLVEANDVSMVHLLDKVRTTEFRTVEVSIRMDPHGLPLPKINRKLVWQWRWWWWWWSGFEIGKSYEASENCSGTTGTTCSIQHFGQVIISIRAK